jgi:flagellar biosynthesis chaperone FliJ
MASNIKNLKIKADMVKPLMAKDQVDLDILKQVIKEKKDLLADSVSHYEEKISTKNTIEKNLSENMDLNKNLNVVNLNNARYYLDQLDSEIEEENRVILEQEAEIDTLKDAMSEILKKIELLKKHKEKWNKIYFSEKEKKEMNTLDDLFLSRINKEEGRTL